MLTESSMPRRCRMCTGPRSLARAVPLVMLTVALALASTGCAKRVPIQNLGEQNVAVHAILTTVAGESLEGTLVSLDATETVVAVRYEVEGDVRLQGYGEDAVLYIGSERAKGELVDVGRSEEGRYAVVRRTFATRDVASATFHRGSGERSLGSIVSMFLGPVVGMAAGFIF